jgi:hypothetical protein
MKMTTSTRQVGGVTIVEISGLIELGEESGAVRHGSRPVRQGT